MHAKKKQKEQDTSLIKERRAALKSGNDQKYKEIIQKMIDSEQTISDEALKLAAAAIDMDMQEIEDQLT